MKYDYSVIGAGVSGMWAAILLAQKGYRTALIEKAQSTGPTIRGFTRGDIFFDTGFHYAGALGPGEPLDRLFQMVGISGKIETLAFDRNGFDLLRCMDPSFEFPFPCGVENLRTRLIDAFPGEDEAVGRTLQILWNEYQKLPTIHLDRDFASAAPPFGFHEESLAGVLDRITAHPLLRLVFSMHCLLHGVLPREIPITNHAAVTWPYYESAHGISGGGRRLAEAFDGRLQETGVDVYCGRGAEKILVSDGGRITGVHLEDGSTIESAGCIATVHPASLLQMAPERAFRPAYRQALAGLEDTSSALILYGTCREPVERLRRSNLFVFPTADAIFGAQDGIIETSPVYITGARTTDRSGRGSGAFTAICPTPNLKHPHWSQYATLHSSGDSRPLKKKITERLRAHVEALIPELRHNIEFAECATPFSLMKRTHNPTGSLYGVKHKVDQVNPMPLTKVQNLYLAGQAVTGPGILGAATSALVACGYVVGHEEMRKELKQWV
jgi:all-trans-retinol 13,14-reductase